MQLTIGDHSHQDKSLKDFKIDDVFTIHTEILNLPKPKRIYIETLNTTKYDTLIDFEKEPEIITSPVANQPLRTFLSFSTASTAHE